MANRYVRAAGGNYQTAGTWELTSGGGESVAVPTSSDDVFLDAHSGQLTVDGTSAAKSVDCTGYTGTITHNAFAWTISGTVKFVAGMTYTPVSGSSFSINATGNLTSGGKTFRGITINNGTVTLQDNLTFTNIKTTNLTLGTGSASLNLNGKTVSGDSSVNRVLIATSTLGTTKTITVASGTFANTDFRDITFSSASSLDLSAITGLSGDCGGNTITGGGSTLTFTTAATQTWSGTSGGNWSANAWTSRVPLPQDDVVISSAFSSGQTITGDMPRMGKSIDLSGMSWTGTATVLTSTITTTNYGSITLKTGMTFTWTNTHTFEGRGSFILTSSGKSFGGGVNINMVGGTLTLADAFSSSSTVTTLNNGTFVDNGFSFTSLGFNSSTSTTRAVTKTGSWTINGSGSRWTMTTTTGLTWSDTGSLSYAPSSAGTFNGGSLTYNNVTINPTTGAQTIAGSNTFNTLTISAGKTATFTSGTTQTLSNFVATGTAGNLITLNASTGGSAATITAANTIPKNNDYLSITDINVTNGTFFYGGHSTYVSGTGWKQGNSADMFRSLY